MRVSKKRIETMAKERYRVRKSNLPGWIIRSLPASGLNRLSKIATLSDNQSMKLPDIGPHALALIRAESERSAIVGDNLRGQPHRIVHVHPTTQVMEPSAP